MCSIGNFDFSQTNLESLNSLKVCQNENNPVYPKKDIDCSHYNLEILKCISQFEFEVEKKEDIFEENIYNENEFENKNKAETLIEDEIEKKETVGLNKKNLLKMKNMKINLKNKKGTHKMK